MELKNKTLRELKNIAKDLNISGWSAMKRKELILTINNNKKNMEEEEETLKKEIKYRLKTSRILYKGEKYTREQLEVDQETARLLYEAGLKNEIEIIIEGQVSTAATIVALGDNKLIINE